MKCAVGDIVLINNFTYPDGTDGTLHSFVVVDVNKDEFELVTLDYMCFLISSQTDKNSDVNPNYPCNESIAATKGTGLKRSGHVKCDYLFTGIKEHNIFMKVGMVEA
ncbi:MAG: hypothetical protein FWF81_01310 [Defluviitaleaceae bacterium]|nr:hypothetical protein [Defluviitaleaceae bacterium]